MKSKNLLFTLIAFITLTLNFALGQNCNLINSATFTVPESSNVILSATLHRFPKDTIPLNLNQWNYIAMVIGTNQYQIYVNGKLAHQGIYSSSGMNWYKLHLGAHEYIGYSGWFDGWIDEMRISNNARSAAEISNYHDSNLPFANDGSTIGLWHFDQTLGAQLNSATGPSGTISNAQWEANGKFGSCLYFNGINALTTMNMNIPINNMTCEFWIKPHVMKSSSPVDWYGLNTSGLRIDMDTINNAKYTWSTGATGKSITVNPKDYKYIWVSNGSCKDTIYFDSQITKVYDTVKEYVNNSGISNSGLVAYYPFNGNANDESGNNHNGAVVNGISDTDRFGNLNSAFSFDGNSGTERYIYSNIGKHDTISFSVWFKSPYPTTMYPDILNYGSNNRLDFGILGNHPTYIQNGSIGKVQCGSVVGGTWTTSQISNNKVIDSNWHNITVCYIPNDSVYEYIDNKLIGTKSYAPNNPTDDLLYIGRQINDNAGSVMHQSHFNGTIDDIRIYNRKLNKSEISNLYYEGKCVETTYDTVSVKIYDTIQKFNNEIRFLRFKSYYSADNGQVNVYEIQAYNKGTNVALNKSGYASSYEWGDYSSNGRNAVDGDGFSRWSSNRNDLGPDSLYPHSIVIDLEKKIAIDSLILNIKGFDNWNQTYDFDVSSDALYWRNVGKGVNTTGIFTYYPKMPFVVYDTLHFAVYDKVLVSVTDTLIINAVFTGINPPNNVNTIRIYPNPAKDHITIDYGNYPMQAGYTLKILNSLGQAVFTTPINQQQSYVDLSSWTAKGIYYVHLIDAQGKTVELRKIVLQ